ncbi:MAG: histidine kinase, partial [Chitinophagaceae bacterium]|nr:histidine kinase [Chitinophagaceae bacterium]
MYFKWTSKKWATVALHLLFWTVIFTLPSLLRPARENYSGPPKSAGYFYQYLCNCATWIALFYLNANVLIPRFILTEKYKKYILYLLPVFGLLFLINWSTFVGFVPERQFRFNGFVFYYIFPCLFFLACSTAWVMFRHKVLADRLSKEKETLNLTTELAFLRSQVSPH